MVASAQIVGASKPESQVARVLIANTRIDGRTKCPVVGSSFDFASEIIDSVRNNVFSLFINGFGAEMRF